jgi:TRAP-type C4-dicarboxylate transport system permease small subunit
MKSISDIEEFLSRAMYLVAGVALTAMVFLIGADVIMRYFGRAIVGTYEIVGLLGAVVVGFSLPQTTRLKGHVVMDFVTARLPAGLQNFLQILTRFLGIVVYAIIAWNVWLLGDHYKAAGETTHAVGIPFYPVAYAIAICCFVQIIGLCLALFTGGRQEVEK